MPAVIGPYAVSVRRVIVRNRGQRLKLGLAVRPVLFPSISSTSPSSLYSTFSVCVRRIGSPGPRTILTGPDHFPARKLSLRMASR
jgi:hypothetical protein